MKTGIESAVNYFGSQSALASQLGVKQQSLQLWYSGKRSVPIKRCVQIERLTNGAVTRKDLRPDDYHEIWTDID